MSTGKNENRKISSLYTVIYIAAVLALAGCIAFLVWDSVKKDEEFGRRVEEIALGETEYVLAERPRETETEAVTEAQGGAGDGAAGQAGAGTPQPGTEAQNGSGPASQTESAAGPQAGSSAGSQAESSAEPQAGSGVEAAAGDLQASILVLNGARKPGVAAYWQSVLLADGYTNVSTATYSREASERTSIYYSGEASLHAALVLQAYFPESDIIYGTLTEGIEPGEDAPVPEQADVYVVVGPQDAGAAETEETTPEQQQTLPEGQAAEQQQMTSGGQAAEQQLPPDGQTTGQQIPPEGQTTGQQIPPDGQTTGQQISPDGQAAGAQEPTALDRQMTGTRDPVGTPS